MFTAQGGMERRAEALITRISHAVGKEEGISVAEAKADFVQSVSLSLARSAVQAITRRRPPPVAGPGRLRRTLDEARFLEEAAE